MKSYREILREAERRLAAAGVPEPKLDAWYLFEAEFHMSKAAYLIRQQETAPEIPGEWEEKIRKRCERIPLQYILGYTEFMGLSFRVGPGVLIPRQDTETLVELVLRLECGEGNRIPGASGTGNVDRGTDRPERRAERQTERQTADRLEVLDLCTGSGCIGLSLAVLNPAFHVTLADASRDALAFARKNRDSLCPDVAIYEGDLFGAIPDSARFDVMVSNPPYIATAVIGKLQQEVKAYEPVMALDGKEDGLFFYRRIAEEGRAYMKPGARVYLEIGYDQGETVPALLTEAGFTEVTVHQDLAGLDRVVRGVYQNV